MILPTLFLFFRIPFASFHSYNSFFPYNFKSKLSLSRKNPTGILVRMTLNPQISLGGINFFPMLSLQTHEHEMSFPLFVFFFLISITSFLCFLFEQPLLCF